MIRSGGRSRIDRLATAAEAPRRAGCRRPCTSPLSSGFCGIRAAGTRVHAPEQRGRCRLPRDLRELVDGCDQHRRRQPVDLLVDHEHRQPLRGSSARENAHLPSGSPQYISTRRRSRSGLHVRPVDSRARTTGTPDCRTPPTRAPRPATRCSGRSASSNVFGDTADPTHSPIRNGVVPHRCHPRRDAPAAASRTRTAGPRRAGTVARSAAAACTASVPRHRASRPCASGAPGRARPAAAGWRTCTRPAPGTPRSYRHRSGRTAAASSASFETAKPPARICMRRDRSVQASTAARTPAGTAASRLSGMSFCRSRDATSASGDDIRARTTSLRTRCNAIAWFANRNASRACGLSRSKPIARSSRSATSRAVAAARAPASPNRPISGSNSTRAACSASQRRYPVTRGRSALTRLSRPSSV